MTTERTGGTASRPILLTGSTGFVGRHLARRLVRDAWTVHVIVRPGSDLRALDEIRERLVVHVHDGSTDSMRRIMQESKPVLVYHLASFFLSEHKAADIVPLVESNVLFGTQLAEAMAECGVLRLVNTGTSWQHFEGAGYNPVNLYAATKQAFESILEYYVQARALRVVTLQLFDTYGPGDTRRKLFRVLAEAAAGGQTLDMSPGEQLLDIVHIDDAVNAFVLAGERLVGGVTAGHDRFGVSSGARLSLREVVSLYEKATGRTVAIRWGGRSYRPREVMAPWTPSERLPGWAPRIGLEEGMRKAFGGV